MIAPTRVLVAFVLVMGAGAARPQASPSPTLILTGGKIFTADSAHLWAQAIAIRGERIVAVGTDAEIRRRAGARTRSITLGGRVVIPGVNDAHDHLAASAPGIAFLTDRSPTPDPTTSQVFDSLRALVRRTPAGTWLRTSVGMRVLGDTTIDRTSLDEIAPRHPVVLYGWWGHGMIVNSAALRALGIRDDAPDPLGGKYGRAANGRLDGRVDEYAKWAVQRRLSDWQTDVSIIHDLRAFADSSLRVGVTSTQDMAGYLPPRRTVHVFREANLPIRVRIIRWPMPTATSLRIAEWDSVPRRVSPRVVVDGRKWVIDGTPIEQLALMTTPYPGRANWYGRLNFPLDTVRAMLADALRPNAPQLHLHVVGDSTTELVLNAMEALAPDSVWRTKRVRIEHGGAIVGQRLERARRKGIVIAQPRSGAPFKSWNDAGMVVAYGSDNLRNPFLYMLWAVTGADHPEEAISREAAVRMLTLGSAYAERQEREKGRLAPGMLADLAVLSQDVFTVDARALPATRSVLTVIGGKIVYDGLSGGSRPK